MAANTRTNYSTSTATRRQTSTATATSTMTATARANMLRKEVDLKVLCWIPFNIEPLTIGTEGGRFLLQPEGLDAEEQIVLDVPENAINEDVCRSSVIRFGILVDGPFVLEEGYKLASPTVYLNFNPDHFSQSAYFDLTLPHWISDREDVYVAVAPYGADGNQLYKFNLQKLEEGYPRDGVCIPISQHGILCAFAVADGCCEQLLLVPFLTTNNLEIIVAYDSTVWLQILQREQRGIQQGNPVSFQKNHSFIRAKLSKSDGPGWWACIDGPSKIGYNQVDFKARGYSTARDLREAVRFKQYPPRFWCRAGVYDEIQAVRKPVEVVIEDTNGKGFTEELARFYLSLAVYEQTWWNLKSAVSASSSARSNQDQYSSRTSSVSPVVPKRKRSRPKRPPARKKSTNRAKRRETILSKINADCIVENFGKEVLIRELEKLLNKRRATVLESRNLINVHCKNSIKAKLTLGANDDAATEVVEYFEDNHDGNKMEEFCVFLEDMAGKTSPQLIRLAKNIRECIEAVSGLGTNDNDSTTGCSKNRSRKKVTRKVTRKKSATPKRVGVASTQSTKTLNKTTQTAKRSKRNSASAKPLKKMNTRSSERTGLRGKT